MYCILYRPLVLVREREREATQATRRVARDGHAHYEYTTQTDLSALPHNCFIPRPSTRTPHTSQRTHHTGTPSTHRHHSLLFILGAVGGLSRNLIFKCTVLKKIFERSLRPNRGCERSKW